MVELICLLLAVAEAASDYGEYHFFKNFGESFYDYSGNGYHAINGATADADGSDALITDRGAYFNGASYITIHNSVWSNPGPVQSDWSSVMWMYATTRGLMLSRYREDTSPRELSVRYKMLTDNNMSVDFCVTTTSPCTLHSSTTTTAQRGLSNFYCRQLVHYIDSLLA